MINQRKLHFFWRHKNLQVFLKKKQHLIFTATVGCSRPWIFREAVHKVVRIGSSTVCSFLKLFCATKTQLASFCSPMFWWWFNLRVFFLKDFWSPFSMTRLEFFIKDLLKLLDFTGVVMYWSSGHGCTEMVRWLWVCIDQLLWKSKSEDFSEESQRLRFQHSLCVLWLRLPTSKMIHWFSRYLTPKSVNLFLYLCRS